jgi:hypoxanthine phosphoribosyltransferase
MSNDSPELYPITHERFLADVQALAHAIASDGWVPDMLVGIGRGGLVPTVYLSHRLNVPMLSIDYSSASAGDIATLLRTVAARSVTGDHILIIDDINDSGGTISRLRGVWADMGGDAVCLRFAVLLNNVGSHAKVDYWADMIDRKADKRWFVFPWEALATQQAIMDEATSVPDRLA